MTASTLLWLLLAAGPVFATSGFTKAAEVRKGCVASRVGRLADLVGFTGTVTSKFAVDPDGSVSLFEPLSDAPGQVVAVIWEAIQGCQFTPGRDPQGVPVATWMILPLRFVADGPPPIAGTPPREAEPGCISNQLKYRFPPNRLLHGLLSVQAAISAEGKVGAIGLPPDLPDDVVNAFTLSLQGCEFRPARTPEGRPTGGTFEYRVDFGQPGAAGRAAGGGPRLKREARLSNTLCLQRLRPFGVIGHAVVQVTVTPEGEPTDFRLQPQNLPADLRTQIVDVLSMCKWETALDLDEKPVAGDAEVTIRYR